MTVHWNYAVGVVFSSLVYILSFSKNYITSIESNETNLASALGELLSQLLKCLYMKCYSCHLVKKKEKSLLACEV